jgi:hypothetical protein
MPRATQKLKNRAGAEKVGMQGAGVELNTLGRIIWAVRSGRLDAKQEKTIALGDGLA